MGDSYGAANVAARLEKRTFARNPKQLFVKICVVDESESEDVIALTTDINENGISLITQIPLPLGTIISIKNSKFSAIGEICDWDWECAIDMARLGVRFIEKHGVWPLDR